MRGAVLILLLLTLRLDAAVALINAQVATGDLTTERVRDLLLGRVTTWPSGEAVVIVLCTGEAGERAVQAVCSRSVGVLQRGWKRLVFAGTGAMPQVVDSLPAAQALIARTPGAITVVVEAPPAEGVRAIPLDGGAPGRPPVAVPPAQ